MKGIRTPLDRTVESKMRCLYKTTLINIDITKNHSWSILIKVVSATLINIDHKFCSISSYFAHFCPIMIAALACLFAFPIPPFSWFKSAFNCCCDRDTTRWSRVLLKQWNNDQNYTIVTKVSALDWIETVLNWLPLFGLLLRWKG